MHLNAQKHQLARFMKSKYANFLELLLQQFNFQRAKETAPAVDSEKVESEGESTNEQQ